MAGRKKLSREEIHALRGSLKRKPGDKPLAEWWAEHHREEKELEERRFRRRAALGKKRSSGDELVQILLETTAGAGAGPTARLRSVREQARAI